MSRQCSFRFQTYAFPLVVLLSLGGCRKVFRGTLLALAHHARTYDHDLEIVCISSERKALLVFSLSFYKWFKHIMIVLYLLLLCVACMSRGEEVRLFFQIFLVGWCCSNERQECSKSYQISILFFGHLVSSFLSFLSYHPSTIWYCPRLKSWNVVLTYPPFFLSCFTLYDLDRSVDYPVDEIYLSWQETSPWPDWWMAEKWIPFARCEFSFNTNFFGWEWMTRLSVVSVCLFFFLAFRWRTVGELLLGWPEIGLLLPIQRIPPSYFPYVEVIPSPRNVFLTKKYSSLRIAVMVPPSLLSCPSSPLQPNLCRTLQPLHHLDGSFPSSCALGFSIREIGTVWVGGVESKGEILEWGSDGVFGWFGEVG